MTGVSGHFLHARLDETRARLAEVEAENAALRARVRALEAERDTCAWCLVVELKDENVRLRAVVDEAREAVKEASETFSPRSAVPLRVTVPEGRMCRLRDALAALAAEEHPSEG